MTYSILFSSHRLLKVLELMALLALALAFVRPYWGAAWFRNIEQKLRRVAAHGPRAVLVAALFPMAVRVLMLPWYPPPPPQIHDEFSYLLQGDTFAHGRVANVPPPYWEHFETEYTLLQPKYASQYQPAQGLVLAAGEVIFGHPWWGVWLSVGLMCGCICWALRYVVPHTWAFAGAIGAALQFGIFGLWMNSYFGGAVAAAAGALVMGSLARLKATGRAVSSGALCAAGVILLFASRPFEAILWSGVAGVFVLWQVYRQRSVGVYRRAVLSFACLFFCGAAVLAWYNWRITGNPLDPPYLAYQRVYGTPQPYWWQGPVRVQYSRFPELRDNYLNQQRLYERRHSLREVLESERSRIINFWRFFIGPFLSPAIAFLLFLRRDYRIRSWLIASIPFVIDKATYHAWYPSQNAPATILIVLVFLQAWRHMRVWLRERGVGLALSRYMVAALALAILLGNAGRALEPVLPSRQLAHLAPIWESLYPARRLRDDIITKLNRIPGKHLVFVKYSADHCFCEEWVFNSADLKNQRIVFARPYTPESDEALAQYFGDHDVWVIEPDSKPYRLARVGMSELASLSEPAASIPVEELRRRRSKFIGLN